MIREALGIIFGNLNRIQVSVSLRCLLFSLSSPVSSPLTIQPRVRIKNVYYFFPFVLGGDMGMVLRVINRFYCHPRHGVFFSLLPLFQAYQSLNPGSGSSVSFPLLYPCDMIEEVGDGIWWHQ